MWRATGKTKPKKTMRRIIFIKTSIYLIHLLSQIKAVAPGGGAPHVVEPGDFSDVVDL
jgi:hypothetical protein